MVKKKDMVIMEVRKGNSSGQLVVTIPKGFAIEGDYVTIIKIDPKVQLALETGLEIKKEKSWDEKQSPSEERDMERDSND